MQSFAVLPEGGELDLDAGEGVTAVGLGPGADAVGVESPPFTLLHVSFFSNSARLHPDLVGTPF